MTKQEFLEMLRLALNGKVSSGLLTENLRYYEDYINTEIRKGKSEEEVLAALGDPRLIARTIVETKGREGSGEAGRTSGYTDDRSGQYGSWGEEDAPVGKKLEHGLPQILFRMPLWVWLLLVILVVILILSLVFSLISALLPILLPILLVLFLVKLLRDGGR